MSKYSNYILSTSSKITNKKSNNFFSKIDLEVNNALKPIGTFNVIIITKNY